MPTEPVHRRHLGPAPHLRVQKGPRLPSSTPRDRATAGSERSGATTRLFVGRERELAELTAGLEEAVSGRGSLFRPLRRARNRQDAAGEGDRRSRRAPGGAGALGPPVGRWRTAGVLAVGADSSFVRAERGSGGPGVRAGRRRETTSASWCPSCRRRSPRYADGSAAQRLDSDNARFYLFDSVTEFLRNGATRRPLVIVLDDLHAADLPSLLLLRSWRPSSTRRGSSRSARTARRKLGALPRSPLCSPISRERAGASRSAASPSATSRS